MASRHVKKGDNVIVLAGKYKGRTGRVLDVYYDEGRVRVEGVAVIHRHLKPGKDPKRPNGGIFEDLGTVHISNVSPVDPASGKPTRVASKVLEDGRKVRIARRSGEVLA